MKKTLLLLIGISIVLSANAGQTIFGKIEKKFSEKQNSIKQFTLLKTNSASSAVPTLRKYSSWDGMNMNWNALQAVSSVYLNNRLTTEYYLSYDSQDTSFNIEYTYDLNGRISTEVSAWYNNMNATFTPMMRMTYLYSNNGLRISITREEKDSTGMNWVNAGRFIQEYNDRGTLILNSDEYFDNATNRWTIAQRYSSTITYYQNSRTIITQIDSVFDINTKSMVADRKSIRSLNSTGQILTLSEYASNAGVMMFVEHDSLFYDVNKVPIEAIGYDPNSIPNLIPVMKTNELIWYGSFNATLDLFENEPIHMVRYSAGMLGWELAERSTTTFPDNYGSKIGLDENYENNAFVPNRRNTRLNDSHKNSIKVTEEYYDTQLSKWNIQYGSKDSLQYDANDNLILDINQYYDNMFNAFTNQQKTEFSNFISISQGFNTLKNTIEVKIFPNPSTDGKAMININLTKSSALNIEVSDVNGRVISSEKMIREKGLNTITLSNLSQGLYIISVTTDTGINKSKLLVK